MFAVHCHVGRSARSWLSNFSSQTAYRPMTIFWRYHDTSIFTSRQDGPERSGFPVTLGPDFWKFRISKNSVFQEQEIFPKIDKKFEGLHPVPPPYGATPLPPTKVGAKCLAVVVLDNLDRALRPRSRRVTVNRSASVKRFS